MVEQESTSNLAQQSLTRQALEHWPPRAKSASQHLPEGTQLPREDTAGVSAQKQSQGAGPQRKATGTLTQQGFKCECPKARGLGKLPEPSVPLQELPLSLLHKSQMPRERYCLVLSDRLLEELFLPQCTSRNSSGLGCSRGRALAQHTRPWAPLQHHTNKQRL